MKVKHNLKPIYNSDSKVLILGTMPSVISREKKFYYANPSNRFWKVMESIFDLKLETNKEKEKFLLEKHIALWDVISSCNIDSSSDYSIKNVKVNDINILLKNANIKKVFCTGKKSYELFKKNFKDIDATYLPSNSSANIKMSLEDLIKKYRIIKDILD